MGLEKDVVVLKAPMGQLGTEMKGKIFLTLCAKFPFSIDNRSKWTKPKGMETLKWRQRLRGL